MTGAGAAALMALLAADPGASAGEGSVPAREVVDMAGRRVAVPGAARRIACLEVLCYEKLFLLGASDRIAMMISTDAPWMRRTNPAVAGIQQLGADPSAEELLRQRVDVVFRTYGYPAPGKIELLAGLGIPVLVSQAVGANPPADAEAFVESRKRMLRLFAEVLGPEYSARAEEWCAYHDRLVALVRSRVDAIPRDKRARLYCVRGPRATDTQGLSSATYWYGILAGADMVVKNSRLTGKGELAIEEILKWDPEVIHVGRQYSADVVLKDPRWASVSAVRAGRVREMPEGVFYWDGSTEGVLSMLYTAKELYPALFQDVDLKRELREYYARFYRYSLSDDELELMLQGKGPDGRRNNEHRN